MLSIQTQARHSIGNPALLPGQQIQQQMQQQQMQQQQQQQQQLYDQVNCDYDAPGGPGIAAANNQNFGNPYDCPEGMYGGSMVSSVGYSKVI